MSSTFTLPIGTDRYWQVQIQTTDPTSGDQIPYTGFISGDTLTAAVWSGQDQSILCSPSATWVGSPSAGLMQVSFAAAQTASLTPGRYKLRVQVVTTDGRTLDVLDSVVKLSASPGTATPLTVYCLYSDLLQYASWLDDLEDLEADLSGFAKQRAQARAHLDRIILGHVAVGNTVPGYLGFGIGSLYGLEGTNPYVLNLLNTNKLVVTPQVVEITARYTVALIADTMISPTDDASGYQRVADKEYSKANALLLGYIAEFDVLGTGVPPYWQVPCNIFSTRVPTPIWGARS
jgi:hypothetical protein